MSDIPRPRGGPRPPEEPRRDARLGALLRDLVGDIPMSDVRWDALSARIGAAIRASQSAPWWSYLERWQRRALPLALAAGLGGALVLVHPWAAHPEAPPLTSAADLVSAVVAGAPSADAAMTFTSVVVTVADLSADVE